MKYFHLQLNLQKYGENTLMKLFKIKKDVVFGYLLN
jgi:hypothetical protein